MRCRRVNPLETSCYAASKVGLIHLTRRMSLRLVRDNIVVSGVAPGAFASAMNRTTRGHGDEVARRIPAGRIGAGDYVVGQTIVVDSGATLARG